MGCDNWPQQEEKPHVGFNDWPAKTRDEQEIDSLKKVVATKDKEIEALKADNEALAELIRLKEAFDPSEYHKDLIRGYKAQRVELRAEIKQLREVVERTRQYCESGNGCGGATKLPSGEWHNEGEGTLYHAVLDALSSKPIEQIGKDETKKITLQMYECNSCLWYGQVGESIETESCDICPECKSEDLKLCDE